MSLEPREITCGGCGHSWEFAEDCLAAAFVHMKRHEHQEDLTIEFRLARCNETTNGLRCILDENHSGQHEVRWS